ncbi:MAG: LacI family DNA-binding transcriptional regulator [Ancalomicrobiaceae bacterium]|nr:LacI family DNA-binding transcriptional regulator [Ancalomicrobiaceae bacterium]
MSVPKIKNMAEFAEISGLSRPTVSKYFIDPDSVRQSTRDKIERALRKYDYRPNLFAVNLNKKKSNIIGIIVPDIVDPFYASLVSRIEAQLAADGHLVVVLGSRGDATMEAHSIDVLLSLRASAAIIAPLGLTSDVGLIESLGARIPIVYLDSRLDTDVPFIGTDNFQSMGLITDYLCRTGERPTYVELPEANHNAVERRMAYVRTMERNRLAPEIVTLGRTASWRFEEKGYSEAMRLFAGAGFPTRTLLCVNDRVASGVMAAAYQSGLRIGREPGCDLRIAGHDDHPLSRFSCPPLTTVAQDIERMSTLCVEALLARLVGGVALPPQSMPRLTATLMMRASA